MLNNVSYNVVEFAKSQVRKGKHCFLSAAVCSVHMSHGTRTRSVTSFDSHLEVRIFCHLSGDRILLSPNYRGTHADFSDTKKPLIILRV